MKQAVGLDRVLSLLRIRARFDAVISNFAVKLDSLGVRFTLVLMQSYRGIIHLERNIKIRFAVYD